MAPPYGRMRRNTALACAPVSAAALLGVLLVGSAAKAEAQSIRVEDSSITVSESLSYPQQVWLSSEPTDTVVINVTPKDATLLTVSPESLTFTPQNWNTRQELSVTPANDNNHTRTHSTSVDLAATGGNYDGLTKAFTVAINDDEPTPATVPEGLGANVALTYGLNHHDGDEVTVNIASSDTTLATVSPSSLTFTRSTPNSRQTFRLEVVDNNVVGGPNSVTISTTVSPLKYRLLGGILLTITDDDMASWSVGVDPSSIEEDGGISTVTVSTGGVTFPEDQTVALALTGAATKGTDYTVGSESLTLAAGQSSVETTVTGVDDMVDDDAETVVVTASVDGSTIGAAQTITIDDDDARALVIAPESLTVDEEDDATYTVKLASEPTAAVTVAITGYADTDLTLDETSLTFTTSNWSTAQTVEVSAADDDNGVNETATLTHNASGGDYDSLSATLGVTTLDNDQRGFDGGGGVERRHAHRGGGRQQRPRGPALHPADGYRHRDDLGRRKHRPDADPVIEEPDLHHLELEHRADRDGGGRRGRQYRERGGDAHAHGSRR